MFLYLQAKNWVILFTLYFDTLTARFSKMQNLKDMFKCSAESES